MPTSVERLQEIGYERIALGGMVPLQGACRSSTAWRRSARSASRARACTCSASRRTEHYATFRALGVASLDSTSPFRQAFKDDKDNYYTPASASYVALRIPPSDGNAKLQARIRAGQLDQRDGAGGRGRGAAAVRAYDAGSGRSTAALDALRDVRSASRQRAAARPHAALPRHPRARALEAVPLRGLPALGRRGGDLPRHRAQQAPRLPQPLGLRPDAARPPRRHDRPSPERDGGRSEFAVELRLPALEIRQGERRLYQFALDGKRLPEVTHGLADPPRRRGRRSAATSVPRCSDTSRPSARTWRARAR